VRGKREVVVGSYCERLERGVRNITICNIERLARALKVTIAELVS
jgi:transcriptional regulator with XRE-family HTH domain